MYCAAQTNSRRKSPMLDKNLITKKLALIEGYISELEPIIALDEAGIVKDNLKSHTAERLFQLIVDTMVDVNTHIIRTHVLPPPDDLQSTFTVLGEKNILPADFTKKIAPVVGLRNAVVHRYDTVSIKRFVHELKKNFGDFKEYVVLVAEQFLKE